MQPSLESYYRQRAGEYDEVYTKPERQADLSDLRETLQGLLADRCVLEVAAGTGYWTQVVSNTAKSILGTDIADEMLAVARDRNYGAASVRFAVCDAFALANLKGVFDAALACFWFSHIPISRRATFLDQFSGCLQPGSRVVLADNRYVGGSSSPIAHVDPSGDTYQRRLLENGKDFQVLKNFPEPDELVDVVKLIGVRPRLTLLDYYWIVDFETRNGS